MTARLNQIIAIEKGIKSDTFGELGKLNKTAQKAELFNGFFKNYQPVEDTGEQLPAEKKLVQFTTADMLSRAKILLSDLMQVTARKDWSNCKAVADITVDGKPLLTGVPVTYLLFLEKQITDFHTLVGNLPILDANESWAFDSEADLWKTEATKTHRTKKVQRPIVLYNATPEHPAQTQLITEDQIVGFWNQTKQSGAMRKADKEALLSKVSTLLQAIKEAREAANSIEEVDSEDVGKAVFGYLLS